MKLLQSLLIIVSLTISANSYSQEKEELNPIMVEIIPVTTFLPPMTATKTIRPNGAPLFPVSAWTKKNTIGFDLSEIAFVNWSAGGTNSISGLFKGNFTRNYATEKTKWVNELIVKYGISN